MLLECVRTVLVYYCVDTTMVYYSGVLSPNTMVLYFHCSLSVWWRCFTSGSPLLLLPGGAFLLLVGASPLVRAAAAQPQPARYGEPPGVPTRLRRRGSQTAVSTWPATNTMHAYPSTGTCIIHTHIHAGFIGIYHVPQRWMPAGPHDDAHALSVCGWPFYGTGRRELVAATPPPPIMTSSPPIMTSLPPPPARRPCTGGSSCSCKTGEMQHDG